MAFVVCYGLIVVFDAFCVLVVACFVSIDGCCFWWSAVVVVLAFACRSMGAAWRWVFGVLWSVFGMCVFVGLLIVVWLVWSFVVCCLLCDACCSLVVVGCMLVVVLVVVVCVLLFDGCGLLCVVCGFTLFVDYYGAVWVVCWLLVLFSHPPLFFSCAG